MAHPEKKNKMGNPAGRRIAKFKIGSAGVSPACFYYFTPKTRIFAYFALHAGETPAIPGTLQFS